MEENTLFAINKKYDPLAGRYIREIKSNDIVHISAPHDQYTDVLVSSDLDENTELLITGFMASGDAAGNEVYVTVDSSTILPTRLAADTPISVVATVDAPIFRCAASSTITISTTTAGSYTAALWGVRHPLITKVETA